ncbi:MIP/aquaporin family protein [Pseudonocardia humida]|uniref:Aquaporin family protein n=1 Tax=Pseudonocardia humida TaxID=2800819 RepID=A0ABT1A320_9PSEU|nr:MIP/aquaporin family protein [Pseudonocardia humida]MCO1657387.1 aquaporin family protein [Pseudonocardia humida]
MAKNSYLGELLAEFLGTMILILFGVGVVAQVVTNPDGGMGDHDSIAWAWGIGVTMGVYVAARLSGAHINPAVTIALAAFKGFPWRKVLPYSLAQTAGAFVAAAIVRVVYSDLIARIDPEHTIASQGIFSTLPGNGVEGANVTITTAFFDQIVGTAILVFVVFALVTATNNPPMGNMAPLIIGLLVVGIGMAWGANAGYAINPARDFGPRLLSLITGYETALYDQNGALYFWLPIVAPIIGGLLGGALFKFAVESFLPAEVEADTIPDAATDTGRSADNSQNA